MTRRDVSVELALLKRQQRALEARDKFMTFVKFTSPDVEDPDDVDKSRYKDALHHRAIARVLEEVEQGKIKFLILTMPPRHGKSQLVSRHLPAWFLGRNPHQRVAVATYNDDFAKDFGSDVRNIMHSPAYKQVFPYAKLARGGSAKERLETTSGGGAAFVGLGGSLTGRGAHLLVIDDVIKSQDEARSKAFRDRAWDWFTKVAMTRRMGKKLVIITFTRWHTDDIIGRLTDPANECFDPELAAGIQIINLPALAEDDDPLGREPGAPLWPDGPDTYDEGFLQQQRRLDPLGFSALYQQRPTVADGVLFRRENLRWYGPDEPVQLPGNLRFYCASDHAVSTAQRADSTVLLKVGVDAHDRIFLVDCWWQKRPTDAVVEAMLLMAGGAQRPLIWWAERGHISKSIGPFLRKRLDETGSYLNLIEVTPVADKESRAQSIAARIAMGKVFFPRHAPWAERAVNELLSFPNGLHDDFVDALSWVGLGLRIQAPASTPVGEKSAPKYGTLAWVKAAQRRADRDAALAANGGF